MHDTINLPDKQGPNKVIMYVLRAIFLPFSCFNNFTSFENFPAIDFAFRAHIFAATSADISWRGQARSPILSKGNLLKKRNFGEILTILSNF